VQDVSDCDLQGQRWSLGSVRVCMHPAQPRLACVCSIACRGRVTLLPAYVLHVGSCWVLQLAVALLLPILLGVPSQHQVDAPEVTRDVGLLLLAAGGQQPLLLLWQVKQLQSDR
jgi:hypothetical protein